MTLSQLLKFCHLSQFEFAFHLEISTVHVWRLLTNRSQISAKILAAIVSGLSCKATPQANGGFDFLPLSGMPGSLSFLKCSSPELRAAQIQAARPVVKIACENRKNFLKATRESHANFGGLKS